MSYQPQTGNPAFRALSTDSMAWADTTAGTMTVQGTAIKTLILTAILMVTATWSWIALGRGDMTAVPILIGGGIAGFVLALITCFRPTVAPTPRPCTPPPKASSWARSR